MELSALGTRSYNGETSRASTGSENPNHQPSDKVVISIRKKLNDVSIIPSELCIFRVPNTFRVMNNYLYDPRVISIGPLHHGNRNLQAMEEEKLFYLNSFLGRTEQTLESLVEFIAEKEHLVRACYAGALSKMSSTGGRFVEMIVVDAVYIIELLRRNYILKTKGVQDWETPTVWNLQDVAHDLMLLENQLPFFVLEGIFSKAKIQGEVTLIKMIYEFFRKAAYLWDEDEVVEKTRDLEIKHFVDFFRQCHIPAERPSKTEMKTFNLRKIPSVLSFRSVKASNGSLLDIKFHKGTLVIPRFEFGARFDSFLMNNLVFEHCHSPDFYIRDYVHVLTNLVGDRDDIKTLVKGGVVEGSVSDNEDSLKESRLFKAKLPLQEHAFSFKDLCDDLNAYDRRQSWMAIILFACLAVVLVLFLLIPVSLGSKNDKNN